MEKDCRSMVANVITMQTTLIGNTTMTSHGTVVGFECIPGFSLQGAPVLRCQNGNWDKQKPTCSVSREPSSSPWRLSLSQADVIVLAACSALLLFLLVLAVVVCVLYRHRVAPHSSHRGNYIKQLQQRPPRGRQQRRRRSSSVTSLTTEEELSAWNTHMPWYTPRRQTADQRDVHRTWAGVLPSYYPSYVTNDVPKTSSMFPMTSYYHWQPVASMGRGLSRYDVNTLGPFDTSREPTSLRMSRPSRHSPLVFDPHNPVRWDTDKKAWHSFDYSQSVLPRPQLRSSPLFSSDATSDSLPRVTDKGRNLRSHEAEGSV